MDVFCTSPWVPFEWIDAHGFQPRGVWHSAGLEPVSVPEGVCAFARAAAEFGRRQPGALMVFTTACDQLRRAADSNATEAHSGVFLFNLPATWQTGASRRLYEGELARLGRYLESAGGRAPTDAGLEAVMRRFDQERNALGTLLENAPAHFAAEALMRFFCDPSPERENIQEPDRRVLSSAPIVRVHGPNALGTPRLAPDSKGIPLALIGGPLLPSQWPLFDAIEAAGGRVALNATEPGERCLLPSLPEARPAETPLSRLARHYFDHAVDVFHRPDTRLYDWLSARIVSRRIRGLVLWVQVGCDLWRAQAASLREAFDLPVLVLASVEGRGGGPRDLNRLAAFIESLQ